MKDIKIKVEQFGDEFVATEDFGDDLGWLGELGVGKTEKEAIEDLQHKLNVGA